MRLFELYREERGSIFTHDGHNYDLNMLFRLTDKEPTELVPLDQVDWIIDYDQVDLKRMLRAHLSAPILVTWWFDPDAEEHRLVALDGLHRIAKAQLLERPFIKAIFVSSQQLDKCLIDQ